MSPFWLQVLTSVIVSLASGVVTWMVVRAAKLLEKVATKEFVTTSLTQHATELRVELGKMFMEAAIQQRFNEAMEHRMRTLEILLEKSLP